MFYVYWYKDPDTLVPFYIGKGCRNRANRHLYYIAEGTHQNRYFSNVVKALWANHKQPIIEIIKTFSDECDAYDVEQKLIEQYGRRLFEPGGVLTNLSLGGRGPIGYRPTDEARANQSKALKGLVKTEAHRKNMKTPKGQNHKDAISKARSWDYRLISPAGEVFRTESLKLFCESNGLNLYTFKNASKHGKRISRGHAQGWQVIPLLQKEDYGITIS